MIAESITPHQLAEALGAERSSSGWRCPLGEERHANGDRDPSFSVFRDGNRTAARCHACGLRGSPVNVASEVWGIKPGEAAHRLARSIGLQPATNGRPSNVGRRNPEGVYTYRNLDGDVLFQVVRFREKRFRQRSRDPDGDGWRWTTQGVEKTLYRVEEVVERVAQGDVVYVVEGEKDVDRLREEDVAATTCPGGAGAWRAEYGSLLKDARVRVVADRDEAGLEHAREVAASLVGTASSVEVLLPAVHEEGADVSDHLAAGYGLDDLDPLDDEADNAGVRLRALAEILDDPTALRPPDPVADRLAWTERVTLLAGREKLGKTTLAAAAAAAVSRGAAFFGEPTEPGNVLWVQAEGHPHDLAEKLVNFGANPRHVFILERTVDLPAELRRAVDLVEPVLVIIDTLFSFTRGLEVEPSNASAWTDIMGLFEDVARADPGPAVALLHHAKKSDGSYRDSSAIGAGVDVVLEMYETSEGDREIKARGRWSIDNYAYRLIGRDSELCLKIVTETLPLEERVRSFIERNAGCSKAAVRESVVGRAEDIDTAVFELLEKGALVDHGTARGSALHPAADQGP